MTLVERARTDSQLTTPLIVVSSDTHVGLVEA